MNATNATRRASWFVEEMQAFIEWWRTQLLAVSGTMLRLALPSLRSRTIVTLHRGGGRVALLKRDQANSLFDFSKAPDAPWPMDLKIFGSIEVVQGTRTLLGLSEEFVLTHELTLPDAVERNLDSAVELYLEREFPLTLNSVWITHEVVRRVRSQRQLVVRIKVVRREVLQQVISAARAWGLRITQVGTTAADGRVVDNFLRPDTSARKIRLSRMDQRLLAMLLAVILIAGSIVAGQWSMERYHARQALEQVKPSAQSAQAVAHQLNKQAGPALLLGEIGKIPDAAEILAVLTEQTSADTWIYQLSIRAAPRIPPLLEIAAFTPPSLEYQKSLEDSDWFEQVVLISAEDDPGHPSLRRAKFTAAVSLSSVNPVE